jgi:hypothetical protein
MLVLLLLLNNLGGVPRSVTVPFMSRTIARHSAAILCFARPFFRQLFSAETRPFFRQLSAAKKWLPNKRRKAGETKKRSRASSQRVRPPKAEQSLRSWCAMAAPSIAAEMACVICKRILRSVTAPPCARLLRTHSTKPSPCVPSVRVQRRACMHAHPCRTSLRRGRSRVPQVIQA